MSTGMAGEFEISEALEAAKSNGCPSVLLFHCISSYPAPIDQANLKSIVKLKKQFGVEVGLSDHTLGNIATTTAIALGACAIEKHFTISRSEKGPDSEFSIEPDELKTLVNEAHETWRSLGSEHLVRPESESGSKAFRRSIYFVRDMKAGQEISASDIRRIRPGFGLAPKHFDTIIGRRVLKDVERGEAVTWEILSGDRC
jgi:sialic acid synthase SpsE